MRRTLLSRLLRFVAAVALLSAAGGCGAVTAYRVKDPSAAPREARGEDCQFRIIDGYVAQPYEVIGRVELESFGASGMPETLEELHDDVSDAVCEAGGDGFFAVKNEYGRYAMGLVLHFLPPPEPAAPVPCTPTETDSDSETEPETETDSETDSGAAPESAPPTNASRRGAAE